MNNEYLISKWAIIRRNELVDVPEEFEIHQDFLKDLDFTDFEDAFRQVHDIFYQIYTDIALNPDNFGFELYKKNEYDYFSKEAREARSKPWDIFYLLLYLFYSGEFINNMFIVDAKKFRSINKINKTNYLLKALSDYGLIFSNLKDYKLTPNTMSFEINYPDNRNILNVLSLVAKKVMDTQLKNIKNHFSNAVAFSNGFISWNYKILKEDLNHCRLAQGIEYVTDKLHNQANRDFAYALDKLLIEKGYYIGKGDSNEGPSMRYYETKSKSAYDFSLTLFEGELILELRIRNAEKCLEYLKECPDRIKEIFRQTDIGCQNRINKTCKYGVGYIFENEEKWHCGCCNAQFKIRPSIEDIPHYLKLVELGSKRNKTPA